VGQTVLYPVIKRCRPAVQVLAVFGRVPIQRLAEVDAVHIVLTGDPDTVDDALSRLVVQGVDITPLVDADQVNKVTFHQLIGLVHLLAAQDAVPEGDHQIVGGGE